MSGGSANDKVARPGGQQSGEAPAVSVFRRLLGFFGSRNGDSQLRESIEEIIEEIEESANDDDANVPIGDDERVMLTNILNLRHLTAYDVMVPRADIGAVEIGIGVDQLIENMSLAGHSRLPVYRETLDEVVGMVHIKDVVDYVRKDKPFDLSDVLRRVLIVAPSMPVLDLLLKMRQSRLHMALVVDEYGGIDGLVTIEDLVEEIVGEIEDEHDVLQGRELRRGGDGTVVADARATIEEFEKLVGPVLSDEERDEDVDTLGGLIFTIAGRVPGRGELIEHEPSGIVFEVLEADPRRIKQLRLRNLPQLAKANADLG
jgi:CBS domain containing-hemolysin-like protein